MNPFAQILTAAAANNWCVKPFCTTCGAFDYRRALGDLRGDLGLRLTDALCKIRPEQVNWFSEWPDALETAVRHVPVPRVVIESWTPRIGQDVRFDDVVTYRLVRRMPENAPERQAWLRAVIPLAIQSGDFSLTESLILTLRENVIKHRDLLDAARRHAQRSTQMRRVLANANVVA